MELVQKMSSLLFTVIRNDLMLLSFLLPLFTLLFFDFMKRRRRWSQYPPGPMPLPFIGTIMQIDSRKPHLSFKQLSKKYGNIYSLQNFYTNVVVLNGYKTVKEAIGHNSEDFADRPPFVMQNHIADYKQGLILARYNQTYKELRKFLLTALKEFGMGKKSLEEQVAKEAEYLCSAFKSQEGLPFDPHYLLNNAVSNIICSLTFGHRFDYEDQEFQKLLLLFENSMGEVVGLLPQLIEIAPCLLYIPTLRKKISENQSRMIAYIYKMVKSHIDTWDSSCRRDIIDAFLEEIKKRKKDVKSGFNYDRLYGMIVELFGAGTETVTTTLRWALVYLSLYPEVQRKVQEEINEVIGKNRSSKTEDQASMPYTHAVINEIQRLADVTPLMLPHVAYRDTVLQGFFIPKGTTVLINLSSVLKDETIWEKPLTFYPEHFLDEKGQYVKREAFLPFSAGSRMCLGEQLAKTELFIFLTTLLQNFTFRLSDKSMLKDDGRWGFTIAPPAFQIQALPR
uniref:Cytochrome P450 n=1 Tax=Salvator merianae TaxID=96440 RepID=A0A8D0CE54_SALMN